MNGMKSATSCTDCPARVVCRCLQISEETVVEAIAELGVRNIRELRRCTGAGEGCTACHVELQELLLEHAPTLARAS